MCAGTQSGEHSECLTRSKREGIFGSMGVRVISVVPAARAEAWGTGGGHITQSKNRLENVTFINLDSGGKVTAEWGVGRRKQGKQQKTHHSPLPKPVRHSH